MFPFQADLEAGLAPATVLESEILPELADHLAPGIEEVARDWIRRTSVGGATRVGSWWGDDVELPAGRLADELRAEQYRHFLASTPI